MTTQRPVALVTGGGTGIGSAAVIALAKAGHDVVINYSRSEGPAKSTADEAAKFGAKTLLCKCDVSDEASVKAMFAEIEKTFGRLDVLINNAGTTTSMKLKDLDSISVDEWDKVFAVNVRGPHSR